jgi:hypothetical protein
MSVRVKTRWHKDKDRSTEELAGALGFNLWKAGLSALLELENEGFMTYSNDHRLQVMSELLSFMLHAADRLAYRRLEDDQRQALIAALGLHLARLFAENKRELLGNGDYLGPFLAHLNQRIEEYSELGFGDEPHMDFLRHFAECLEKILGDSQNKYWVNQYAIEIVAPNLFKTLSKTMNNLFG